MKQFVIIPYSHLIGKMKAGTDPLILQNGQVLLTVTTGNEEYLKGYIKYSSDQIRLLDLDNVTISIPHEDEVLTKNLPFLSKTDENGRKIYKRMHGMGEITLNPAEIGDVEFEIPYTHAKLEGIEIMDQSQGIRADLFIEDSDTGIYTTIPRYQLNQFGFGVYLPKDFYEKKSSFDSDLYYSMWAVLQLTNNSNVTQTIRANIELNEVKQ